MLTLKERVQQLIEAYEEVVEWDESQASKFRTEGDAMTVLYFTDHAHTLKSVIDDLKRILEKGDEND